MKKIKFLLAIFLAALLLTSCGTTFPAHGGDCKITVKNKGRNVILQEDSAAELTALVEQILSDEQVGITELLLLLTMDEVKDYGKRWLSIDVEYSDTREFPISRFDRDSGKVIMDKISTDHIMILVDDDSSYVMAGYGVFLFPQKYYDEIMEYIN